MKVRADEHVSPQIVEAVCRVCLTPGWTFDHVCDAGDRGSADEHWVRRFADDGGSAIITADRDFTTRAPQVVAVFDTGLKVIQMPPRWGKNQGFLQAGFILIWWPRIEAQLQAMRPRECYRPEWNVSKEGGTFKKIDIRLQDAHRKVRKVRRKPA